MAGAGERLAQEFGDRSLNAWQLAHANFFSGLLSRSTGRSTTDRRDGPWFGSTRFPCCKPRERTKYWLFKQMGMSYQNFNKMINNQTSSVRYENIELLCRLLHCTPNELFLFEEEPS